MALLLLQLDQLIDVLELLLLEGMLGIPVEMLDAPPGHARPRPFPP